MVRGCASNSAPAHDTHDPTTTVLPACFCVAFPFKTRASLLIYRFYSLNAMSSWLRNIQGQLSDLANEVLSEAGDVLAEATEEVADPDTELVVSRFLMNN